MSKVIKGCFEYDAKALSSHCGEWRHITFDSLEKATDFVRGEGRMLIKARLIFPDGKELMWWFNTAEWLSLDEYYERWDRKADALRALGAEAKGQIRREYTVE